MIMAKKELLRISTFNCRGLGESNKRNIVLNWLKRSYSGIIFLQETHSTKANENYWFDIWEGTIEYCHGKSSARGVAILISPSVDIVINEIIRDTTSRFILLDTTFNDQNLILTNIYAPTKDKIELQKEFFHFVHNILSEYSDKNIILGGDFNVCINPNIDKKGGSKETVSQCSEYIQLMMDEYNLIDVWRCLNPNTHRYTRREMCRNGLVQSRLDYWLVSNHILYDFYKQDIAPGLKSDHSCIHAVENRKISKKGKGIF